MDELRKKILEAVRSAEPADRELALRAYDFAERAHEGFFRKDGAPYVTHPVAVALDVWERYGDAELMAAALLHDVPEDSMEIPVHLIYHAFGKNVGFLVDSVTKNVMKYEGFDAAFGDKIEKLLWGGLRDVRCLLLKIADRDDNLRTIDQLGANKQVRMTFETQAVYEPLRRIFKLKDIVLGRRYNISLAEEALADYCEENGIADHFGLKDALCNTFFSDFDRETFRAVYAHSANVIWKINDRKIYKSFVGSSSFDEKVEVISVEIDQEGKFCSSFRFKQGFVSPLNSGGFSIGALYRI